MPIWPENDEDWNRATWRKSLQNQAKAKYRSRTLRGRWRTPVGRSAIEGVGLLVPHRLPDIDGSRVVPQGVLPPAWGRRRPPPVLLPNGNTHSHACKSLQGGTRISLLPQIPPTPPHTHAQCDRKMHSARMQCADLRPAHTHTRSEGRGRIPQRGAPGNPSYASARLFSSRPTGRPEDDVSHQKSS